MNPVLLGIIIGLVVATVSLILLAWFILKVTKGGKK